MILELLQLIGKIDVIFPYEGTKSHCTKFAIIRNGREETQADPGFKNFDFDYVKKATCNLTKGSRANVSKSYGYSLFDYELYPDKDSGCYRPSLKSNTVGNKEIASIFMSMSDSIRDMDTNADFYHPLHPLVDDQKKKFSLRIGTAAGLDSEESKKIIGEGMTLFCNLVPSQLLKEECGQKDTWEPRILCHLELKIENFWEDMPIMPHTDRKNCPHENFNILACTSKFVTLKDQSVVLLGGLLYFRKVCSHFVLRNKIGNLIEQHLTSHLRKIPMELKGEIYPHVSRLLQSKQGGGIFASRPHLNKCMYFSILVDQINLVSRVHNLTLPRRVELCLITLALNGMDLPWVILTNWAGSTLPKKNLFMAFIEAATSMNNGTICSSAAFRRTQPSLTKAASLPEILFMNQVRCLRFLVLYCQRL
jgi:hypothetical protein